MLRKVIKSLFQLWTPLILIKFQVFGEKCPGKYLNWCNFGAPCKLDLLTGEEDFRLGCKQYIHDRGKPSNVHNDAVSSLEVARSTGATWLFAPPGDQFRNSCTEAYVKKLKHSLLVHYGKAKKNDVLIALKRRVRYSLIKRHVQGSENKGIPRKEITVAVQRLTRNYSKQEQEDDLPQDRRADTHSYLQQPKQFLTPFFPLKFFSPLTHTFLELFSHCV